VEAGAGPQVGQRALGSLRRRRVDPWGGSPLPCIRDRMHCNDRSGQQCLQNTTGCISTASLNTGDCEGKEVSSRAGEGEEGKRGRQSVDGTYIQLGGGIGNLAIRRRRCMPAATGRRRPARRH
jgi:hypothetical protein